MPKTAYFYTKLLLYMSNGKVGYILIRTEKKILPVALESVDAIENVGLKGDHYNKKDGSRQITLIQADHLQKVCEQLLVAYNPLLARRNIVVSDISIINLPDQTKIQIGNCIIEKTGPCDPCNRMEENFGN